jgi:hypothetical protein
MNIFKWLSIPSGEKVDVRAYKTWVVRWYSRHGQFAGDTQPEAEIFTTKEDAEKYAQELREAFKLVRHTSGILVKVEDNNK